MNNSCCDLFVVVPLYQSLQGKSATITVANGEIKVEVPEGGVTNKDNESIKLTGTIDEK